MARTLDMLDAALNSQAASAEPNPDGQPQTAQNGQPSNQQGKPQPGQQGQPQPGQPGQPGQPAQAKDAAAQAMAQAQAAMAAAAQAAANAMKSARSETPSKQPSEEGKSELADRSEGGTLAQGAGKPYQTPGEAKNGKAGDWGKLPKQVAEELTQGQREAVAGEYRSQIETYYRVIAERAKKP